MVENAARSENYYIEIMKLAIRGHDLGKRGQFDLPQTLASFDLDGLQLVPYKAYADIEYSPAITNEQAKKIAHDIFAVGKQNFLIGAYFNPVHSNKE